MKNRICWNHVTVSSVKTIFILWKSKFVSTSLLVRALQNTVFPCQNLLYVPIWYYQQKEEKNFLFYQYRIYQTFAINSQKICFMHFITFSVTTTAQDLWLIPLASDNGGPYFSKLRYIYIFIQIDNTYRQLAKNGKKCNCKLVYEFCMIASKRLKSTLFLICSNGAASVGDMSNDEKNFKNVYFSL